MWQNKENVLFSICFVQSTLQMNGTPCFDSFNDTNYSTVHVVFIQSNERFNISSKKTSLTFDPQQSHTMGTFSSPRSEGQRKGGGSGICWEKYTFLHSGSAECTQLQNQTKKGLVSSKTLRGVLDQIWRNTELKT